MSPGVDDACDFKVARGLGGWRPGTVTGIDGRDFTVVDSRGNEYVTRQVRQPKASKAAATSRRRTPTGGGRRAAPAVIPGPKPKTVRLSPEAVSREVERRGPWRCPEYLDYVRAQPCAVCKAPPQSEASHHGRRGIGQKADDSLAIALCAVDHAFWHQHGLLPGRTREESDVFVERAALALIVGFLRRHTLAPVVFELENGRSSR